MHDLLTADKAHVLNTYKRLPIEIVDSEGAYLIAADGTRYLDMMGGIAVNALGYSIPSVREAIKEQMEHFIHVSNYFVSRPVVELAQTLKQNSFASKVFFCNSGTEANEAALKLARKYGQSKHPDKFEIIALEGGFHGRTFGSMSLTGKEAYKRPFSPVVPGVKHIEINDIDALSQAVSHRTCAIFVEVVQGEGGVVVMEESFSKAIMNVCETFDVLLVVDEIQTGLARTGTLFAFEQFSLIPDVVTLAKALGGGLPLGAMLVGERLENVLQPGDHGSTFGGNPVACAAGKAVLDVVSEPSFLKEVMDKGQYLKQGLTKLREKYPDKIKAVRGLGLMIGVDAGEHAESIRLKALEQGFLINVTNGSIIRLLPPLNMGYVEIDAFIYALYVTLL